MIKIIAIFFSLNSFSQVYDYRVFDINEINNILLNDSCSFRKLTTKKYKINCFGKEKLVETKVIEYNSFRKVFKKGNYTFYYDSLKRVSSVLNDLGNISYHYRFSYSRKVFKIEKYTCQGSDTTSCKLNRIGKYYYNKGNKIEAKEIRGISYANHYFYLYEYDKK